MPSPGEYANNSNSPLSSSSSSAPSTPSTPGKKHLSEIARKIVSAYPQSFRDVIEDQVVGSGYDSITKQLQSRIDNLNRGKTSLYLKRQASSTSEGEDLLTKTMRLIPMAV